MKNYIEHGYDVTLARLPYPEDETEECGICQVMPGRYHHADCSIERCPRCDQKLVSCGCPQK